MIYRFFIDRPIFANVIAIATMLVGVVCLLGLPVAQYPPLAPPTVRVSANYPGANARTLADVVAGPIEQAVNGVQNMLYMSSVCSDNGSYSLTVTFEVGADVDAAQVLVQNRIASALPRLPTEVQRLGVTAEKQSTNMILALALTSPSGEHDGLYLSNYAEIQLKDAMSRVKGVGSVQVFGSSNYGMRIWLDPDKLKARGLTADEVVRAIAAENVQVAAGQVGQRPGPAGQDFQYTVATQGRYSDPEQFGGIVVKSEHDAPTGARLTCVRDVARVELGAQTYASWSELQGKPAAGLGITTLPGVNSLEVAKAVLARMDELRPQLPAGVACDVAFSTTEFVEESIREVYRTLFEAGLLVLVVILVFLQDWRATLIPATTVPVTILGAFGALAALGYSINMLTLFGLVLAIGIVVDDAIVIVENAVHHIDEEGADARSATIDAMGEVLGPIVGITLVLMAVFVPTVFMSGVTGELYRQFALTIAATAVISAINAVTLKPAQCALYLRPTPAKKNFFYRGFNYVYNICEWLYVGAVRRTLRRPGWMMLAAAAVSCGAVYWFQRLPTSFVPIEDQGYAILGCVLDDAASLERTEAALKKIGAVLEKTPGVRQYWTIGGMSLLDGSTVSNAATIFIMFDSMEHRAKHPEQSLWGIIGAVSAEASKITEATVFVFPPPAMEGVAMTGGFEFRLQDRGNLGLDALQQIGDEVVADGNAQSSLTGLQSSFRAGTPQLFVDVDRVKAARLGVPLPSIFSTLQASLGAAYVNDFNKFGRTWQVQVQADRHARRNPEDIGRLEVRNSAGDMVPLRAFSTVRFMSGPQMISRYNLYPSATINGAAAPGASSGQAMALMEQMASQKMPPGMGFEWGGLSHQEKKTAGQSFFIFGMATLMVYLVLAAQYESWFLPAAVILVVPMSLIGTAAAAAVRGMDNNIYTQIGVVLIIALASKNAILIVEFARDLRARGRSVVDAAVEAARLRFRPILMTSFAFILGIFPLVVASGAGAAARQSLGTAVFGGMIAATFLALAFVPAFFVVMQSIAEWVRRPPPRREPAGAPDGAPPHLQSPHARREVAAAAE